MAVNHRKDSIQLIRDTEGINNKDRVRILSPGSSPPEETTEVTEHALYMEPKNTPGDGEPYEYEFACCTGRRFIPQRAGDANKLEGKTSAEVKAMFADGRAVFAGSGTSVSLDAEGDRVHSITVNGFTKQTGSGTPSPENQMPLTNGGLKLKQLVIQGTENWGTGGLSEKAKEKYARYFIQGGGRVAFSEVYVSNYEYYKSVSAYTASRGIGVYGGENTLFDVIVDKTVYPSVSVWKSYLAARYAAGNPIIIWYVPADESDVTGIYIPLIGTGGEYSAKCIKINDHLCAGDKFISRTLSGCDMKVTLDGGKTDGLTYLSQDASGSVWRILVKIKGVLDYNKGGFGFSNWVNYKTGWASTEESFYCTDGGVFLFIKASSLEEAKSVLSQKPLTMWLRSTSYTAKNDKEVSMETHVRYRRILDGTESYYEYRKEDNTETYFGFSTGLRPYNPSTDGNNGISSHFKFGGATSQGYYPNCFVTHSNGDLYIRTEIEGVISPETMKEYAKSQFDAESPMTFVYKLATPITYAHEPVDFEFSPGEDGVFTITGEADGTLDVYYKALQDGGDADKLGGKLPEYYAAAANALGQYTHIKSGTVHELTGTGDNIRFVATADFAAGDTVKVNGTTCTASTMSGDALWAGFFKSGAVVVCYRTGNALNFSGGGLAAVEAAKITPENLKTGVSVTVNGKTVAGTFTADGTAAAGDMLFGKTGYVKGQKVTGTIPSKAAASYKPGTSAQTIKAVQYLSGDQTIEGDAALIAANIKYGASIFDVDGSFTSDANAVAAEILTGKIGYVKGQKITGSMPNQGAMWEKLSINGTVTIPAGYHNGQGKVTQSIPTKGAASYKPGTSAQTILSGQYLTGNQTIQGDGNLVAGNIRSGVSIFGVAGSFMEGSGGYLYMGQRNNTAMYGYAFGSASYSNGIRIGRSGNYLLVMFGYNEIGATGRMKVNGSDVFAYGLNPAAVHTTTKWLNAGDIVTISADEGVNYALTGFVYNT